MAMENITKAVTGFMVVGVKGMAEMSFVIQVPRRFQGKVDVAWHGALVTRCG